MRACMWLHYGVQEDHEGGETLMPQDPIRHQGKYQQGCRQDMGVPGEVLRMAFQQARQLPGASCKRGG